MRGREASVTVRLSKWDFTKLERVAWEERAGGMVMGRAYTLGFALGGRCKSKGTDKNNAPAIEVVEYIVESASTLLQATQVFQKSKALSAQPSMSGVAASSRFNGEARALSSTLSRHMRFPWKLHPDRW